MKEIFIVGGGTGTDRAIIDKMVRNANGDLAKFWELHSNRFNCNPELLTPEEVDGISEELRRGLIKMQCTTNFACPTCNCQFMKGPDSSDTTGPKEVIPSSADALDCAICPAKVEGTHVPESPEALQAGVQKTTEEAMSEQREYNFEDGVAQIFHKIEKLIKTQKYVVVSVMRSFFDVDKTALGGRIMRELSMRGISSCWQGGNISTTSKPCFSHEPQRKGHVLVFGDESSTKNARDKEVQDRELRKKGQQFGMRFKGIDVRIYICEPDRPFDPESLRFADVIINNEPATDEPRQLE